MIYYNMNHTYNIKYVPIIFMAFPLKKKERKGYGFYKNPSKEKIYAHFREREHKSGKKK